MLSPFTRKSSNGLYAHGFRYYFTPLPGYFSPFPHGTSPLSVIREYLGLAGGPARFTANSTSSLLLGNTTKEDVAFSSTRLSRSPVQFPKLIRLTTTLYDFPPAWQHQPDGSHNPAHATPARYHTNTV